jgi:pilus assembly protein Flp/PilA
MGAILKRFARSRTGVTAIEYGLIAALIAVVIIAGIQAVGTSVNNTYDEVSERIASAGG